MNGIKYIKYLLSIKDFYLSKVYEINHPNKNVQKIQIEAKKDTNNSHMQITFLLIDLHNEKKAKEITQEIVENLVNCLYNKYIWVLGDPYISEININGNTTMYASGHATGKSSAYVEFDNQFEELEKCLFDNSFTKELRQNIYHKMYREARKIDDPLVSFIFLYGILLDKKGPGQNKVDEFIKSIEPEIEMKPSRDPRKKGQKETIYTWLRNHLGHTGQDTDIQLIKHEITKRSGFYHLVRIAIQN